MQPVATSWQLAVTLAMWLPRAVIAEPIGPESDFGASLASPQSVVEDAIRDASFRRTTAATAPPQALHQNVLQWMGKPAGPRPADPWWQDSPDRAPDGSAPPSTAPEPTAGRHEAVAEHAPVIQLLGTIVPDDGPDASTAAADYSEPQTEFEPLPCGHSDTTRATLRAPGVVSQPVIAPVTNLANNAADAIPWIAPYLDRAHCLVGAEAFNPAGPPADRIPSPVDAWWNEYVSSPLRHTVDPRNTTVSDLVVAALTYSPQVLAVRTIPEIQQQVWAQEEAAFDWHAFLEATWNDKNDPVGNRLTTGDNSTRFRDQIWSPGIGVRRRNTHGGNLELSQRNGWQQNNSTFLLPNPQTTARLQLNYTQPLLNGAGSEVNTSRTVLAAISTRQAYDELAESVQSHLFDVTETYWELYLARALYLQRARLVQEAEKIDEILQGREAVDSVPRQILRARAEVADRKSSVVRAEASIRNAESRIRLLVNEPSLYDLTRVELIPQELPATHDATPSLPDTLQTALWSRPDLSRAVRELRATSLRLNVAKNQLLPTLDLILGAYSAGLTSSAGFPGAIGDQFSEGRPGYSVGVVFEVPLGNRAAQARCQQRQLEMNQAIQRFRLKVETVFTEVELAVREIETAYREMISRSHALEAAKQEADYLHDRWITVPGSDMTTTLLLEDLLDAQVRLTLAEEAFVRAQVDYSLSLVRVRYATGTLLGWEWNPPADAVEAPDFRPPPPSDAGREVP
ncbi:MAG: TolC family protein [Planctomycetaceae bacterium]